MAKEFNLSIVSPDRTVIDTTAESLIAPGIEGYLGIWANHEPLITALKIGEVTYRRSSEPERHVAITGGFLEVSDNDVVILADAAELDEEIDVPRAQAARDRAQQLIAALDESIDVARAQRALARAQNRIKIAGKS